MNNEPVAWMLIRNESCVEVTEWYGVMRGWEEFLGDNEKIVELYTHPVKELTDEEILLCRELVINDDELDVYDDEIASERFAIALVRAALRKAQEK